MPTSRPISTCRIRNAHLAELIPGTASCAPWPLLAVGASNFNEGRAVVLFDISEFPPTYIGPTWARDEDGNFLLPERTLGWVALGWCSKYLAHPKEAGQPWKFTPEQARFVLWWYAIDRHGRFIYREGLLQRLKGWGKDPLAAVLSLFELCGPCRFDYWAQPNGERLPEWREGAVPVGKPEHQAWVEIYGVSKDSTKTTTQMFPALVTPLLKAEYGVDLKKEIIYANGGRGSLHVKSASHRGAEGGRVTFMVLGEVQHWIPSKGGVALYDTITNNATKGDESRYLAITNAYMPGEGSVGEIIREAQEEVWAGKAADTGFLYDSIEAHPKTPLTAESVRAVIPIVRGDAIWLNVENIVSRVLNRATKAARSRRMWFNQIVAADDQLLAPSDLLVRDGELKRGDEIVLGFDGSYIQDATALVAIRVRDSKAFPLLIEERPHGALDWEVDRDKVDSRVRRAFADYKVVAFFADVRLWESYISAWASEFGHVVKVTAGGRGPFSWDMRGAVLRVTVANELTVQMVQEGHLTFPQYQGEGRELERQFRQHVLNARRRENQYGVSFGKETKDSSKKVDAYAALVLAVAALDAYRNKATKKTSGGGRGWFL